MLTKENTGLIVIDIQGKLARSVHDSDAFVSNCERLIQGAQALNLPIIWVEQNPEKLGATIDELQSLLSSIDSITKFTFDACNEKEFLSRVQETNVNQFIVCGIEAHICVYQTTLSLKHSGYDVHVVGDCIASRNSENKTLAINKLMRHGVEITGLEMCLYEIVKDCRAAEFKSILNLIK